MFVYVCAFFCVYVQAEALRRADHPSKESYRLSLIKKLRKLSSMLQKREQAPKCGNNEEEKHLKPFHSFAHHLRFHKDHLRNCIGASHRGLNAVQRLFPCLFDAVHKILSNFSINALKT
jgi:chemotaxis response regulator CheB